MGIGRPFSYRHRVQAARQPAREMAVSSVASSGDATVVVAGRPCLRRFRSKRSPTLPDVAGTGWHRTARPVGHRTADATERVAAFLHQTLARRLDVMVRSERLARAHGYVLCLITRQERVGEGIGTTACIGGDAIRAATP
jgi:hypothetical protein